MLRRALGAAYEAAVVEGAGGGVGGLWRERARRGQREFRMVLPPPNVTGVLHVGHALTVAVQDSLCRFQSMTGADVHWRPGVDHAGIATQVVVEKKLMAERGLSRHDLGRDAFLELVAEHSAQSRGTIQAQIDRMGTLLDWERDGFFTLDPTLSRAVSQAFVRLFDQGLVYRDTRVVNWCPMLRTAISDIEVDHVHVLRPTRLPIPGRPDLKPCLFGVLHHFSYPLVGGGDPLPVSTTRPETIPGDTAVAVHPEDPRYRHLIGRQCVNPLTGHHLPVVGDAELVDMSFGSGVVKVTPAHSFEDSACGRRHHLPERCIFDLQGAVTQEAGPRLQGMHRLQAREEAVRMLQEAGMYLRAEDHEMRVAVCSRSGDVLEPMVLPQWFLRSQEMGERAKSAVESGAISIVPAQHADSWKRWMEDLHDWCISRQLWWGHRIPAFVVSLEKRGAGAEGEEREEEEERWVAALSWEEAERKARAQYGDEARVLRQDADVLDTWFSSGLLPLSLSGWPDQEDLSSGGYPLHVMETGADILFFWVARMVMLCTHLHPQQQPPFPKILLHSMVRDSAGRKMSKSLGNVIDPLHVIHGISKEEMASKLQQAFLQPAELQRALANLDKEFPEGIPACGADALRFALLGYSQQAHHINLSVDRVRSVARFGNKIWQACRFVLENEHVDVSRGFRHLLQSPPPPPPPPPQLHQQSGPAGLHDMDLWIMQRLRDSLAQFRDAFDSFQLGDATDIFHRFFLSHFCDCYVELVKAGLYGEDPQRVDTIRDVLLTVLDISLRMLHPLMPFLSEELWRHLPAWPGKEACVLHSRLPLAEDIVLPGAAGVARAVARVDQVLEIVHHARAVKQGNPGAVDPRELVVLADAALLRDFDAEIRRMARVQVVTPWSEDAPSLDPKEFALEGLSGSIAVGMRWRAKDVSAEVDKLQKKIEKQVQARDKVLRMLQDQDTCAKAPAAVVEKWRSTLDSHNAGLGQLQDALAKLEHTDHRE